MTEMDSAQGTGLSVSPAAVGGVAVLAGAGSTLLYPLSVAGLLPGIEQMGSAAPRTSHPAVVYFSVVLGPILLTWGSFAYLDDEYVPLTPRRALVAIVPALTTAVLGMSWFAYEWTGTSPTDLEGRASPPLTLIDVLHLELTAIQFVALAAVSAVFVGTVLATRDRRTALATTALPVGLVAAGFYWGPQHLTLSTLLSVSAITALPCAVGYLAAQSDNGRPTA